MRSTGNRGIFQNRLQVLHVHVFLVAPLGTSHMAQPSADQHKGRIAVGESTHHTSAAADFPVEPLNDVVSADTGPVFAGEVTVPAPSTAP